MKTDVTMKTSRSNRRDFLRHAGGAAMAVSFFPTLISSAALGRKGGVAPNSRVAVGCIGVGPQGRGDMSNFLNQKDVQVVAVCDVKKDQLELARSAVNQHYGNQSCSVYEDFRELIGRADIDACLIATPDHWHVPIALSAVRAGRDIYLEKPLSLSLEENWQLRREAQRRKAVFQFGTQQRSGRMFRLACELVRNGHIGTLKQVYAWAPGSAPGGSTEVVPPPPGLNYDFWLGPAPYKPHTQDLCSSDGAKKTWWYKSDYTLGFISGWGIHPLDIAAWGAGDRFNGPFEISGRGTFHREGACDTATVWDVDFAFPSGAKMKFVGVPNGGNRGMATDDRWPQREEWSKKYRRISTHGTVFEGTGGWVHVDREGIHLEPENLIDLNPDDFKVRLTRSSEHVRNFIDCVKNRQKTVCPVDEAVFSDSLCHLAEAAIRLNRKLVWDTKKERFQDDAEADRRLRQRKPRPQWAV